MKDPAELEARRQKSSADIQPPQEVRGTEFRPEEGAGEKARWPNMVLQKKTPQGRSRRAGTHQFLQAKAPGDASPLFSEFSTATWAREGGRSTPEDKGSVTRRWVFPKRGSSDSISQCRWD